MAINGGAKVDFTITGHLPPSSRRKRSVIDTKLKTTKADHRRSSSRPTSVPVSPVWDENNPLSVQSTSIPLSSRSSHASDFHKSPHQNPFSHRPRSRDSGIRTMSSSSTSALHNTCTPRPWVRPPSRNTSQKEQRPLNVTRTSFRPRSLTSHPNYLQRSLEITHHTRSDTDLLDSSSDESIPEILDQSVSKLSSEIDAIIHDINSGLIMGSPGGDNGIVDLSGIDKGDVTKVKPFGKRKDLDYSQNLDSNEECVTTVLPLLNLPSSEGGIVSFRSTEENAAIKIQKWFRECQHRKKRDLKDCQQREAAAAAAVRIQRWFRSRRRSEPELNSLLSSKRKEIKRNRQEEAQRILKTYETEKVQEEEKQQRRAMKMQAARKQAIEGLKKKREDEKKDKEKIIQEEMAMLEASGAVKKANSSGKPTKRRPKVAAKFNSENVKTLSTIKSQSQSHSSGHQPESKKPAVEAKTDNGEDGTDKRKSEVSSSVESSLVDEFFKAGPRKITPKRQSESKSPNHVAVPKQPNTTTVNDIFATLKELEEAPPPLPGVNPMSPSSSSYLSKSNLEMLQHHPVATNISDQKLQSILSYLDDIQKAEHIVTRPEASTGKSKDGHKDVPPEVQEDLSQQLEAASAVANDVTTTIITQRMEIENKNKTIAMLQKALNQQRELTVYHAKETEKESQKRLDLQKQDYEGTIGRHQCFIDQLIDDKKTLSDKCEALLKEVREMDKKYKTKIRTMEDTHAAEMEKQKQTSVATEKLRRERWRAEETQRIKEATVKSLEPEIQRIIARGKAEIQKLKAMHEAELLQADERASRRFLQQTEELRVQCAQEKEMACQHERELARQKYEQLAEQEEQSYQQLRRKLYSEVQQEKDKLTAETSVHREEIGRQLKELKESHQLEMARVRMEHESATAESQRRHMSELRDLKERMSIEKQAWEENYIRKQDAVLLTREREMRERLRRERDTEIETVIQKLEAETATAREECERTAESRVKRIREKYETELKEVEKSERNTLQKFNTMKSQLTEYEGDIIRLRSQLRQREEEVQRINEIATRLTRERDRVSEVVRQEFADRLVALEEENRHIKLEISELKSRHSLELSRKERDKERELEEVHMRVKEALAKKEENYRTLRSQHEAALKRADHLEMLLEQQRKELLKR